MLVVRVQHGFVGGGGGGSDPQTTSCGHDLVHDSDLFGAESALYNVQRRKSWLESNCACSKKLFRRSKPSSYFVGAFCVAAPASASRDVLLPVMGVNNQRLQHHESWRWNVIRHVCSNLYIYII